MAGRHRSGRAWWWGARAAVALAIAGCGKSGEPAADTPLLSVPGPAAAQVGQPFDVATTLRAPAGSNPPPPTTFAGKTTATFPDLVRNAWPTIPLTDADGKPTPTAVTLDTDAGSIEVTLFPDRAPNHVRNFLALAKVGFYDGLIFERVVRQSFVLQSADGKEQETRVELVTAGCPAGDGEPAHGHLGYFLHPESNTLPHEEGTIGFVLTDDPVSACCRFYVCLSPTPIFDGRIVAFGKVTRGMDVIHAIGARPVRNPSPSAYPENEMPREPVRIKNVMRK
jgi:peptidyl-prolyl cis-trans isomerase B (cyclophilin B)